MTVSIFDLKIGDTLIAEEGFHCLRESQRCEVRGLYENPHYAALYVGCGTGVHLLADDVKSWLTGTLDGFQREG